MRDSRVLPFTRLSRPTAEPVSGALTFTNDRLFLPVHRTSFEPRWTVRDGVLELADGVRRPFSVSLVAHPLDEPGELGWLDHTEEGFGGELALGPEHYSLVTQAALSPMRLTLTIQVFATADGEVTELSFGMERTP